VTTLVILYVGALAFAAWLWPIAGLVAVAVAVLWAVGFFLDPASARRWWARRMDRSGT
jgi:hypothetical protein